MACAHHRELTVFLPTSIKNRKSAVIIADAQPPTSESNRLYRAYIHPPASEIDRLYRRRPSTNIGNQP